MEAENPHHYCYYYIRKTNPCSGKTQQKQVRDWAWNWWICGQNMWKTYFKKWERIVNKTDYTEGDCGSVWQYKRLFSTDQTCMFYITPITNTMSLDYVPTKTEICTAKSQSTQNMQSVWHTETCALPHKHTHIQTFCTTNITQDNISWDIRKKQTAIQSWTCCLWGASVMKLHMHTVA